MEYGANHQVVVAMPLWGCEVEGQGEGDNLGVALYRITFKGLAVRYKTSRKYTSEGGIGGGQRFLALLRKRCDVMRSR